MSAQWQIALALLPFGVAGVIIVCLLVAFTRMIRFRVGADSFIEDFLPDSHTAPTLPDMRR